MRLYWYRNQAFVGTMQGLTALQAAAREGWVEIVAVLAGDPQCQVNSTDLAGRTALHWASAAGHAAVVNELWCRGANVQQIDNGGWTGKDSTPGTRGILTWHRATPSCVTLRLAEVPKCDSCCQVGSSILLPIDSIEGWRGGDFSLAAERFCVHAALHYAADAGHSEVVGSLIIAGTLVSAFSGAGWTAAHLAAMQGHTAVIDKLLIGGYQIDCASAYPSRGWTAAHVAARQGHLEVRFCSLGFDTGDNRWVPTGALRAERQQKLPSRRPSVLTLRCHRLSRMR